MRKSQSLITYCALIKRAKKDSVYYEVIRHFDKHKKLRHKLKSIDIIVIRRTNSSDGVGMSKPCLICTDIMKRLGIRRVYYSGTDGKIITERIRDTRTTHVCDVQKKYIDKILY